MTSMMVCGSLRRNGHHANMIDVFTGSGKYKHSSEFFQEDNDLKKLADSMKEQSAGIAKLVEERERIGGGFFGPGVLELCQAADIVYIGLHGVNGEDGKIQAAFDLMGIKYTGTGYLSSAISMSKELTKKVLVSEGVPMPKGISLKKGHKIEYVPYPCVVKPCCGGSSVGVSIANNEEEFRAAIIKGLEFVSHSEKLLTLGIKPNRPETGYGYIQIDEPTGDGFYKVKTFTEKPELELAKVFVESGEFYWNSGLFMWNVNTIIKAGETLLPELASKLAPGREIYGTPEEKDFIEENFPACPNVSIDFGIMEKADNVYVSLGDFGWSDLGTWGSLYDLSPKDEQGNVTLKCDSMIYNSNDNIVVLPKGKLAVIEGLEGFLVAESDNVLLICKKDEEHAIRKYVNDAQMKLGEDYI